MKILCIHDIEYALAQRITKYEIEYKRTRALNVKSQSKPDPIERELCNVVEDSNKMIWLLLLYMLCSFVPFPGLETKKMLERYHIYIYKEI